VRGFKKKIKYLNEAVVGPFFLTITALRKSYLKFFDINKKVAALDVFYICAACRCLIKKV
jgi:hypothetical protein